MNKVREPHNKIYDEYTYREDLTKSQKWVLRNPEKRKIVNKNTHAKKPYGSWTNEQKEKAYMSTQKYREENREKVNERARLDNRNSGLKRTYGITREEFLQIKELQNNRCAICFTDNNGKRDFHLDHNHTTKKVRGILCHNCNMLLGHAKENLEILDKAKDYLIKWNIL